MPIFSAHIFFNTNLLSCSVPAYNTSLSCTWLLHFDLIIVTWQYLPGFPKIIIYAISFCCCDNHISLGYKEGFPFFLGIELAILIYHLLWLFTYFTHLSRTNRILLLWYTNYTSYLWNRKVPTPILIQTYSNVWISNIQIF